VLSGHCEPAGRGNLRINTPERLPRHSAPRNDKELNSFVFRKYKKPLKRESVFVAANPILFRAASFRFLF
jgi:hypothetical protein